MNSKILHTIFLTWLLVLPGAVCAAPVADEAKVPLDLRRTTLIVEDVDKSLTFYRDALGMSLSYDNMIYSPRDTTDIEQAKMALRLVFLQANDDFIGVLGLMQYHKPEKQPVDLSDKAFKPGTAVLVFNHADIQSVLESARQIEGVKVLREPTETSYPSYDGSGKIKVLVSILQDPDGFVVEVNQVLSEIH